MWTPKRIVLLTFTFVLLLSSYRVYAYFLGGIDGLPPLDEKYWPGERPAETPRAQRNQVDVKLQMAYGEECEELKRPIKVEASAKGALLASDEFIIERDGRVRLAPVSLALFSKKTPPGKFPEITTIRGNTAFLTFDKPVVNLADLDKRKIVGCELVGQIEVVHNRGTPGRDDDTSVYIPHGPVHYRDLESMPPGPERRPEVWTDDTVEIKDLQSKPQPSTIKATGLEIYLTNEPPARGSAPPKKARPDAVTGVERIVFRADVQMHLFIDSKSGFLAPGKDDPTAKPPEKSQLVITTHGPFAYDVLKDFATFDIPVKPNGQFPEQVHVNRYHELDKRDQLICERLELQFRRKAAPPRGASAPAATAERDRSQDIEIESAHAIGKQVILTSDAEMLEAHGNDFFYNALTRLTVLKGEPEMWALKEGNEIHARELQVIDQQGAQQATAIGPGRIDLLDKQTGKRPLHARWRDKLVTTRDGKHDLLILTGDAAFIDDEQNQQLKAEHLKVWLEPVVKKGAPTAPETSGSPRGSRRPHHLEAVGQVDALSRELIVQNTDRLVLWFKDGPPPDAVAAAPPPAPNHSVSKPADTGPSPLSGPRPIPSAVPPSAPPASPLLPGRVPGRAEKPDGKPARPMHLSARVVEAHIVRLGDRNDLDRLWTEGTVRVRQDGATPTDKGLDIRGDTLQLTHQLEGNQVTVTGDLAQLRLDKLFIIGPEVNIDQPANKAWVNGTGAMEMESNTTFQGGKLKESVPLTIHWHKSMFFNGLHAEFHGGIQAEQQNARLACQSLQVEMDHAVSLKEGGKDGQPPAKVQRLVCDRSVRVEDTVVDKGVLVKYQRIESPQLALDNIDGKVNASGPGLVRMLQPGTKETPGRPPNAPRTGGTAEEELKLTRVRYFGSMHANNKSGTASFYQNVEVIHVPSEDPNAEPNVDKLPQGGLYIRSDLLKVYSRQEEGKPNTQEMEARGNVVVKANEFWARADVVHFHEAKDQVIMEGDASPVVLYRIMEPGKPPQEFRAKKFIYSRKTGKFESTDGRGIQGAN